jgi:plastocyanin
MKKLFQIGVLLAMIMGMAGVTMPAYARAPQHYTVIVGAENTSTGASIMAYFPHTVKLHVGDSITWKVNSHEIHTVTFLAGDTLEPIVIPAPQGMASPLQVNPKAAFPMVPANGLYDGSTFVNSGIMSTDPGSIRTFTLTFTHQGVFPYVCYVHGEMMSGVVDVVAANVAIPSPAQVIARGKVELAADLQKVPGVLKAANAQAVPATQNPDGTFTHQIILGYMSGNIMVMKFFPSRVVVHPGDTIIWQLSDMQDAPHTVTFYNGAPDLPLVTIAFDQNGPVALINPDLVFPSPAVMQGTPLNSTDFFNSGLLAPGMVTTFTSTVGNFTGMLNYVCAIHDSSGMTASLIVVP